MLVRGKMKYLVVGANGQLGREITNFLSETGVHYTSFSSKELDITDRNRVFEVLESERPNVILDAAAFTAVDKAEDEGKALNWAVNEEGTKNLAAASVAVDATLIYVSTDYVFDGTKEGAYVENDFVDPINEYGKAKLAGEIAIQASGAKYYIVRTSWVFGEFGNNFVYTMRKLGRTLDKISVVDDQRGKPTWTRTLAEFMIHLVKVNAKNGVYNLSNDGEATWFEFAKEILRDEMVVIEPVLSENFPTKASRPKNSVLDLEKAKETGFIIPSWQEALHQLEKNIL